MANLRFSFQEMVDEIEAFSNLAAPFLDAGSRDVLPSFKRSLERYRDERTSSPIDWQIFPDDPLVTKTSRGEYEIGSGGGYHVVAKLTAIWRIRRLTPERKAERAKHFELLGKASTKIRLLCQPEAENEEPYELAMWRMEIGDSASPGCHFHVQVLGEEIQPPFPNSLPVPRLPGLLLTPAAAAEFVLAEIFQDEWVKRVSRDSAHLNRWAPIQRKRLEKLLSWKLSVLDGGGSPWTTLKRMKPANLLFVQ